MAAANQTLAAGTVADPQMALQVGVYVAMAGQPTGSEIEVRSGHMTGAEPMRDEALDPDQDREGSSHFGQDHQNPMDSQGCSAEWSKSKFWGGGRSSDNSVLKNWSANNQLDFLGGKWN